jgi:eukaryotic-like serine/threonine-protein kinase
MQEQPAAAIGQGSDGTSWDKSDRFRVIRRLGAGGAAEVFLALARGPGGFQKLVVLKKPRTSPGEPPVPRNMFFHEARIAARLNHPNCAQVIGIEEIDGVPVIVLEYLEGLTLSALRNEAGGKVPLAVELSVLHDALLGLQHAHELRDFDGTPLGVVHRDVSPQNILVTYDGEVKVLDFGIAKANRQAEQTEIGVIKGKFRYMAPEQINGSQMDARTDLFAAGIILWEALTGQRLWSGFSEAKLLQIVMEGNVPPPRAVAPDVPELLEKVCLRATASHSQDRYHSAQEMALELANAARELCLPSGRELLASYLDTHYREARRAVRAQVESELADATFQAEESGVTTLWEATTSHVSIAPELSDATLPNDSLGGSTVPVRGDATPSTSAEEEPFVGAGNESSSGGLFIGGLLGFLACAVGLLAWNRFAPEPTPLRAQPSFSKPAAGAGREHAALVTEGSPSTPQPADRVTPHSREAAATAASPDPQLAAPLPQPSSASHQPGRAPRPMMKPGASDHPVTGSSDPPVASAAAEAAPPTPACAVPFELTPDGFKRFKPECLPR